MGVNTLWRTALLGAARNLRQNVLRGRIWGFSADSDSETDNDSTPSSRRYRDKRADTDPGANPFSSALYNSSTSSVDLSPSPPKSRAYGGGYRTGHVKGMVATLERTNGRERSGSGSSCDLEVHGAALDPCGAEDLGDVSHNGAMHDVDPDSDPTIEALLATSPGASAWENDLGPRETAKRVPGGEGASIEDRWEGGDGGVTTKYVGEDRDERDGTKAKTRGRKPDRRGVQGIFVPQDENGSDDTVPTKPSTQDADDGNERQALALEETRSLVDAFRQRLEVVERRVAGMEGGRDEPEAARAGSDEGGREADTRGSREAPDQPLSLSLLLQPRLLLARVLSLISAPPAVPGPSAARADGSHARYERGELKLDPARVVAALPSYVLWMGLGVCVVVLRAVVRRLVFGVGRRGVWR
jgi:hypothetical protein